MLIPTGRHRLSMLYFPFSEARPFCGLRIGSADAWFVPGRGAMVALTGQRSPPACEIAAISPLNLPTASMLSS